MINSSDTEVKEQAANVKRTIDYFESLLWVEARNSARKIIIEHPYASIGIAAYLLFQLALFLIFWLRPYWMFRISIFCNKINQKLSIPFPTFRFLYRLPIPRSFSYTRIVTGF